MPRFSTGLSDPNVPDFLPFQYSMKEVRQAGQALAKKLIWTDDKAEEIRKVFAIAHNWRDSHGYPMRRFRTILAGQIKKQQAQGSSAVARLKRMPSIRQKLTNQQWPLDKIQDLAGCRAIVPSIKDAHAVIEGMRQIPGTFCTARTHTSTSRRPMATVAIT